MPQVERSEGGIGIRKFPPARRQALAIALTAGLLSAVLAGGAAAAPDAEQAKLTASDAARADQFGASVAISGDTAVVDAFATDDPADFVAAYVILP